MRWADTETETAPVAFADELQAVADTASERHPDGWRPSATYSAHGGELVGRIPNGADADPAFWRLVISDWGLDPDTTEIVPDSVQIRAWDMPIGKGETMRARYYKANIRPRRAAMCADDVAELAKAAARRTKRPPATTHDGVGFVCCLSDWQIGKSEGGGTVATVERITRALDQAVARLRELRKAGRVISSVWLVGMGDLAEQCIGFYPAQQWSVDCTRREQLQIVRTLLLSAVDRFVDLTGSLVVGAVPGNHGENRANGKMITDVSDNDDLAVFDQVRDALAKNPDRYGHITWHISDELVLTANVAGVEVAWTHMHQGAGSGERKIAEWWRSQVMGNRPISAAQILNTAHYHHLLVSESTGRTIIQVPAMDGGSAWFTERTGQSSPSGMVTYLAGTECGLRGWSDLAIMEGQ